MNPLPEHCCYLVLHTKGAEIKGIGLFSDKNPTTRLEFATFVVGVAYGRDFEEALCNAEALLRDPRYAWAGNLDHSSRGWFRSTSKATP